MRKNSNSINIAFLILGLFLGLLTYVMFKAHKGVNFQIIIIGFLAFNFAMYGIGLFSIFWSIFFKGLGYITELFKRKQIVESGEPIEASHNENHIVLKTAEHYVELRNPYRGVFIMGSNGSGKSESIGIPILVELVQKDFCGIIYDFKFPSLSKIAYNKTPELGRHRFKIINVDDPLNSHKCNPIAPKYLKNSAYVREFAGALVNNLIKESIDKQDFWIRSTTDLLSAVFFYLKDEHPDKCTLPHAMAFITSDISKVLAALERNDFAAQTARSIIDAHKLGASSQVAGVVATLQSAIGQINTPEICYVLQADETPLDINNPEERTILTLANNPSLSKTFAPIYSLITTCCIKQMNQQGKHKSFILLDEAPTLYIPDFDQIPNTARSNKIVTVFMLQDYSQMVDMYKQTKAEVLFSALNNHFYGRIASSKTAKMISEQFGKYDKTFRTSSTSTSEGESWGKTMDNGMFLRSTLSNNDGGSYSTSTSTSETIQQRNIIEPEEFLDFRSGVFTGVFVDANYQKLQPTNFSWYPEFADIQYLPDEIFTEKPDDSAIMTYYRKVRSDINSILEY